MIHDVTSFSALLFYLFVASCSRPDALGSGSQPPTPAGMRGKVVLVQFWTYSCINWRRTMQTQTITDRDFEIEFLDAPVEAFSFTFG